MTTARSRGPGGRWTAAALAAGLAISAGAGLARGGGPAEELSLRWSFPAVVNDDEWGAGQRSPAVAMDALGTVHAVWLDDRDGDVRGAIYLASRPAKSTTWTPNVRVVAATGADARQDPAVTVDAAGRLHVVWTEFHAGDPDIYHSLLPAGGRVWTAPRRINDDTGRAIQWHPSAAADRWGTAHFAWTDERSGSADIYSTRVTVDGWWAPNVRVNHPEGGIQGHVRLAATPQGEIHAVWEDTRGGSSAIYASRLPPGGDTWWPNAALSASAGRALQRHPWVTAAGTGDVHAVWVDEGLAGEEAVRLASLRSGEPYWSADRPLLSPSNGRLLSAAAAAGAEGSLLVLWGETRPGTSRVYSALLAPDGRLVRERVDSSPGVTDGSDPVAVLDADGLATVLWRGVPVRQGHGDILASTARLPAPEYGNLRLEGWLQYRNGIETCTGEGYVVVSCGGVPSHMILNPLQLGLPPFLGSYVVLEGVLKDRDGCPRLEARQIRLTTTPCPRTTGAVTGVLRVGEEPLVGAALHLAGETVTTGPSGRFFFDLLPAGSHPMTATLPCALDALAGPVRVRPGVLTDAGSGSMTVGDVIRDCAIDLQDLVTVAGQYKARPPFYPACTDLDADGTVSLYDLVAVAEGYGQSCPTRWTGARGPGGQAAGRLAPGIDLAIPWQDGAPANELLPGLRVVPGSSIPAPYLPRRNETGLRLVGSNGATGWRVELEYDPKRTNLVDSEPRAPGLQPFAVPGQAGDVWVVENEADPLAGRLRLTAVVLAGAPPIADQAIVAVVRTAAGEAAGSFHVAEAALAGRGGSKAAGTVQLVQALRATGDSRPENLRDGKMPEPHGRIGRAADTR